ncbi:MAG: DUF742 domain-containing protein [Actinomycetota bacterium]|nr:DUF742 domain-containing protein [Actinomycetota bacterium]
MQPWESAANGDPAIPSRLPDPSGSTSDDHETEDESLVRPFVITGGRTRHATVHLRVESLVVATNAESHIALQFEHAAILAACRQPISVAEVAARIDVPLGVAQILVGDLADAGLVRVHEATPTATPALLLRMIDAVRAL